MIRCLVLGAGLLGSHVARHLADSGNDVALFSRGFNPWLSEQRRAEIDVYVGRVETEPELLERLMGDANFVVHLASSSRPPLAVQAPVLDFEQTLTPALTVLQLLAGLPRDKTLLTCSSGGTVYGTPSQLPTPESHPLQPRTPYAISNVAVEHYVDYFRRAYGLKAVVLRFANVYGPGELGRGGQGVIGTWLHQIAIGERPVLLGPTSISRDFLYAEDAAAAVAALLAAGRHATDYNIGSGSTVSLSEIMEILGDVTGTAVEPALGTWPDGHPTADIPTTLLDITRIQDDTDWAPRMSLREGIQKTWDWMTEEWLTAREEHMVRSGEIRDV